MVNKKYLLVTSKDGMFMIVESQSYNKLYQGKESTLKRDFSIVAESDDYLVLKEMAKLTGRLI